MGICWSDDSEWIKDALDDVENVVNEAGVAHRLDGSDEMEDFLMDEYEKLEIYQRAIKRWRWTVKISECRYGAMPIFRKSAVRTNKMLKLNMSYVNDIYGEQKYVLTQAPLAHEENYFVETVLDEKVQMIVILGNPPDLDAGKLGSYFTRKKFRRDQNHLKRIKTLAKTQTFTLSKHEVVIPKENRFLEGKNYEMEVYILYYKEWPDFDVADVKHVRTILELLMYVSDEQLVERDSKIMIHCSAGLGRSGALICSLLALQWLENLDFPINVPALVNYVRRQRLGAVQTYPQYRLIYSVIQDWIKRDRGRTFCLGVDW